MDPQFYYPDNGGTFYVGQNICLSPKNDYESIFSQHIYTSNNLPDDLNISKITGSIYGKLTTTGTFTIDITCRYTRRTNTTSSCNLRITCQIIINVVQSEEEKPITSLQFVNYYINKYNNVNNSYLLIFNNITIDYPISINCDGTNVTYSFVNNQLSEYLEIDNSLGNICVKNISIPNELVNLTIKAENSVSSKTFNFTLKLFDIINEVYNINIEDYQLIKYIDSNLLSSIYIPINRYNTYKLYYNKYHDDRNSINNYILQLSNLLSGFSYDNNTSGELSLSGSYDVLGVYYMKMHLLINDCIELTSYITLNVVNIGNIYLENYENLIPINKKISLNPPCILDQCREIYIYTIYTNSLPSGLSLNKRSGVISGTVTEVFDSCYIDIYYGEHLYKNDNATLNYQKVITKFNLIKFKSYTTAELNYDKSVYGYNVNDTISIVPTYTANVVEFSISEGQLPTGLSLNKFTGEISGTPTVSGTYEVTIKLEDSYYDPVYQTITLKTESPITSFVYTRYKRVTSNLTINNKIAYVNYNKPAEFYPDNDGTNVTYSISKINLVKEGTYQEGVLTIDPTTGTIYYNYDLRQYYIAEITVKAENSLGYKEYTFTIYSLQYLDGNTGTLLHNMYLYTGKQYELTFISKYGFSPVTYTHTSISPTVSNNISFTGGNEMYKIIWTPSTTGTYTIKFKVNNGADTFNYEYTVFVKQEDPCIYGQDNLNYIFTVNQSINTLIPDVEQLISSDKNLYTYTITSGELPTGLSLDQNTGNITGTPTVEQSKTCTIQLTYNNNVLNRIGNKFNGKSYNLTFNTQQIIEDLQYKTESNTSGNFLRFYYGSNYSITPTVTPTSNSIRFKITEGYLPDGITFDPNTGKISGSPTNRCKDIVVTIVAYNDVSEKSFTFKSYSGENVKIVDTNLPTTNESHVYLKVGEYYKLYYEVTGYVFETSTNIIHGYPSSSPLPPNFTAYREEIETDFRYKYILEGTPEEQYIGNVYCVRATITGINSMGIILYIHFYDPVNIESHDLQSELTVDTNYNFSVTATGTGLQYEWSNIPDGMTASGSTLSGTPNNVGTYNVSCKISNIVNSEEVNYEILEYQIEVLSNINVEYDESYEYYVNDNITSSNTDIRPLYYSGPINSYEISQGTLPAGLSINTSNGKITGTPSEEGTYNVTVRAKYNDSVYKACDFSIIIKPLPSIDYGTITVHYGKTFTVVPTMTNVNSPKVTLQTVTTDVIVSNSNTGEITGELGITAAGKDFGLTFYLENSIKNSYTKILTKEFRLYVKHQPLITYNDITTYVNKSFTNTPSTQYINNGSWKITSKPSNSSLSINSSGVVSGSCSSAGTNKTVTVQLTDTLPNTTCTVSDSFNIDVYTTFMLLSYPNSSYILVKGKQITPITPTYDTNGPITFSGSLPAGLSLNTSTGVISGTPTTVKSETSYTITAKAGYTRTFTINFTVIEQPDFSYTSINEITSGTSYTVNISPSQINISSFTLTSGTLPTGLSLTSDGIISGTIQLSKIENDYVDTTIEVTGVGINSENIVRSVNIYVNFLYIDYTFYRTEQHLGDEYNYDIKTIRGNYDRAEIVYTNSELSETVNFDDNYNLLGTVPVNISVGEYKYKVKLYDKKSNSKYYLSKEFTVVVYPIPTISYQSQSYYQGESVNIIPSYTYTDINESSISFSADNLLEGLSINESTGIITGVIPLNITSGEYNITVYLTESLNKDHPDKVVSCNLTITVNKFEVIYDDTTFTYIQGQSVNITPSKTPSSGITFELSGNLPEGLSFSDGNITGTISENAEVKIYQITINAFIATATTTKTININVKYKPLLRYDLSNPYYQTNNVNITPVTVYNNLKSYSMTGVLPEGLSFSDGNITGTISENAEVKDYEITVILTDQITDSTTETASYTFVITVNNRPIFEYANYNNNTKNTSIEISISPTITDGFTFNNFIADNLPQGLSINVNTGHITGVLEYSNFANKYIDNIITIKAVSNVNTSYIIQFNFYQNFMYIKCPIELLQRYVYKGESIVDFIPEVRGHFTSATLTTRGQDIILNYLTFDSNSCSISGTIPEDIDLSDVTLTITIRDDKGYVLTQRCAISIYNNPVLTYNNVYTYYNNTSDIVISPVTCSYNVLESINCNGLISNLTLTSTGEITGSINVSSGDYNITIVLTDRISDQDYVNKYTARTITKEISYTFTIRVRDRPKLEYNQTYIFYQHANSVNIVPDILSYNTLEKIECSKLPENLIFSNGTITGSLSSSVEAKDYEVIVTLTDRIDDNTTDEIVCDFIITVKEFSVVYDKYKYAKTAIIDIKPIIKPDNEFVLCTITGSLPEALDFLSDGSILGTISKNAEVKTYEINVTATIQNSSIDIPVSFVVVELPRIQYNDEYICAIYNENINITPAIKGVDDMNDITWECNSDLPSGITRTDSNFSGIVLSEGGYLISINALYYGAYISNVFKITCASVIENIGGFIVNLNADFRFNLHINKSYLYKSFKDIKIYNTEGLIFVDEYGYVYGNINKICTIYAMIEFTAIDDNDIEHVIYKYITFSCRCDNRTYFNYCFDSNRYVYKVNEEFTIRRECFESNIFDNFYGITYEILDNTLGLSVNSDGVVTGKVSQVGEYIVTVRWKSGEGNYEEYYDAIIRLSIHDIEMYRIVNNVYKRIPLDNTPLIHVKKVRLSDGKSK